MLKQEVKDEIKALRKDGCTWRTISAITGVNEGSVRNVCNPEQRRKHQMAYYTKNRAKCLVYMKAYSKKYVKLNREKINAMARIRYHRQKKRLKLLQNANT